jgi:hypothetical protein
MGNLLHMVPVNEMKVVMGEVVKGYGDEIQN